MNSLILKLSALSMVLTLQPARAEDTTVPCYASSTLKMPVNGENQSVTLKLAFSTQPGNDRRLIVMDQTGRQITASNLSCFPGPDRLCRLEDDNGEVHLKQLDSGRMQLTSQKSALQVESYDDPSRKSLSVYARPKDDVVILNRLNKVCPEIPAFRPETKTPEPVEPPVVPPAKSGR